MTVARTKFMGTVREALEEALNYQERTNESGVGIAWGDGEATAFTQWMRNPVDYPTELEGLLHG